MTSRRWALVSRRKCNGFSQESLAEALGVERSTVQRWEYGTREPAVWMWPKLANALGITTELLAELLTTPTPQAPLEITGTAHWAPRSPADLPIHGHLNDHDPIRPYHALPATTEIDHMHRRAALRLAGMAGAMLVLPPTEFSLSEAATDDLDGYGRLNTSLWQMFALSPTKTSMLPQVRGHQSVLTASLARPHGPATHKRLCALTADLYQLVGEIFFDANLYTDAAHCYTFAAQAAKDADAYDLWACAMTRHAFLSIYEHNFADAAPLLQAAAALAKRGDSTLSTRQWVAAVQAQTYAGLGDLHACQRSLDVAETVRALAGTVHNGGWLRFDGARLAEERGSCFAALGRHDLAQTALTDALGHGLSPRRRASVLTDLAAIGAQRSDPDQVLAYATPALAQAHNTASGVITSKLRGLQRYLTPMRADPRISHLTTQIDALPAASINR